MLFSSVLFKIVFDLFYQSEMIILVMDAKVISILSYYVSNQIFTSNVSLPGSLKLKHFTFTKSTSEKKTLHYIEKLVLK